ncbi:hypothetical protein VMCG_06552 [Cytospora schulzeri]|uniref:Uncharacterized protein n=1 Tax=Cytospora schulzeri TaxID=448051 RepID=A0A423WBL4_9PEZI|nr:hypothetical protein VMCG_06552 [Valsa malicola]
MRMFNKAIDIEEARRRGHTVPEGDIGLEDCTSTSSERDRRQFEQIMRNRKPEHDETAAAVKKYFDEYNAAHQDEWERQWKERKDREDEENECKRKAAVEAALERIRKVPYDQAPTLRQRGELDWAEEEAWLIRELEHQEEVHGKYEEAESLPVLDAADITPTEQRPQGEGENRLDPTAEGSRQDHGHDPVATDAPHEPEKDGIPEWAKDPGYIALYGPYDPNFEPWIVKQKRLQKEQEQREKERWEQWQTGQAQKKQDKEDQGKGTQGKAQTQHSAHLQHHEDLASPSDYLRTLLPANFPRYRNIHGMNDMGAYLANASYAVSLGGPPSADIKYGIIVVPVGEEGTLFGKQPSDVMTPSFVQEVYDSRYARHLAAQDDYHEASHDSAEFLRPRFASVASGDRSLRSLEGLVDPAATAGPEKSHDIYEEDNAIHQPANLADASNATDTTSKAVNADTMHDAKSEDMVFDKDGA